MCESEKGCCNLQFSMITSTAICVIIIILTSLSYVAIKNVKLSDSILESGDFITNNWNKRLITDIQLVINYAACAEGFQKFSIGQTPITNIRSCIKTKYKYGIDTPLNDFQIFKNFWKKRCYYSEGDYYEDEAEIDGLDETSDYRISLWRNTSICLKTTTQYRTSVIVDSNTACPGSYKKCYGDVDTEGNNLCVRISEKCPINFIAVIDTSKYGVISGMTVQKFKDDSNMALVYTNNVENYPEIANDKDFKPILMSSFYISEGYPCAIPYEKSKPFNEVSVNVINFENYNKCATYIKHNNKEINYNPYFKALDTDYAITVLKNNRLFNYYASAPHVNFNNFYKKDYVLGYSNYYGIKRGCSKLISSFTKLETNAEVLKEKGQSYADKIISIENILICILTFVAFQIFHPISLSDDNFCAFLYNFTLVLSTITAFGLLITVTAFAFAENNFIQKFYPLNNTLDEDFQASQCYDNYIYSSNDFYEKKIQEIGGNLYAVGVYIVISLVAFIFNCCNGINMMMHYDSD